MCVRVCVFIGDIYVCVLRKLFLLVSLNKTFQESCHDGTIIFYLNMVAYSVTSIVILVSYGGQFGLFPISIASATNWMAINTLMNASLKCFLNTEMERWNYWVLEHAFKIFIDATKLPFFKKKFIYLAVPGLSCGTRDPRCGVWDL